MSKQYTVQAPDGKMVTLEGPDGATPEEVIRQAQLLYKPNPAGSLEYKQETARQQFEANKPVPTAGTQMATIRDRLLGLASNAPGGIVNLFRAGLSGNVSELANQVAAIPGSIITPPIDYVQAIANKNPEAAANAATDIVTNTLPAVYGATELAKNAIANAAENTNTARIFNRVAGVPAGQKGAQTAIDTGAVKTSPGNAVVRALDTEGKGKLAQLKDALLQRPTEELQTKVYGERVAASKALEGKLKAATEGQSILGQSIDASNIDTSLPKVQAAMKKAGISQDQLSSLTPLQAHQLRSAVGDLVPSSSWAVESPSPATEALKDTYFDIGSKIEDAVPDIGPYNKRWQEAYLYQKALRHQLDLVEGGAHRPISTAQKAAIGAGTLGGAVGTGLTAYELIQHFRNGQR